MWSRNELSSLAEVSLYSDVFWSVMNCSAVVEVFWSIRHHAHSYTRRLFNHTNHMYTLHSIHICSILPLHASVYRTPSAGRTYSEPCVYKAIVYGTLVASDIRNMLMSMISYIISHISYHIISFSRNSHVLDKFCKKKNSPNFMKIHKTVQSLMHGYKRMSHT